MEDLLLRTSYELDDGLSSRQSLPTDKFLRFVMSVSQAGQVLAEVDLPELPNHYHGKVPEQMSDLPDGRRIVASDRLSAFDRIVAAIPSKGQVLTQTARFWFEQTADICPNHVLSYPDPNVVVGKRLDILPVEMVVREYLAGTTGTSILTLYKQGRRDMYGLTLPDGLRDNVKLPEPILTPTSKEFDGGHDEPLSPQQILDQGLVTAARWETMSAYALSLFARGRELAAKRGLSIGGHQVSLAWTQEGQVILADEIHSPNSSRYWFANSYPEALASGDPATEFRQGLCAQLGG